MKLGQNDHPGMGIRCYAKEVSFPPGEGGGSGAGSLFRDDGDHNLCLRDV